MKKRILALMLSIVFCFTLVPSNMAHAAEVNNTPIFSEWAYDDLVIGDTYGIYPVAWYNKSLTKPISGTQLRVLFAGVRSKILNTEDVIGNQDYKLDIQNKMTVEEVLKAFYTVISNYEYTASLGFDKNISPVNYMKECGIFTGKDGELGLQDICSVEQACVFATRIITYVYDILDAASKGFLWEIQSGDHKVYMLGSIHIASEEIYPFSDTMLEAYNSSDSLVVEININDTTGADIINELILYSDGTMLKDHISAECYTKMLEIATLLGLTEEQIAYIKPWYFALLFTNYATVDSTDPNKLKEAAILGVDQNFLNNATAFQKPILEIESYELQFKVFDNYSEGLQEYLLNESIDALNDSILGTTEEDAEDTDMVDEWLQYWHDGDVDAFMKSMDLKDEVLGDTFEDEQSEETKAYMEEYFDALITQRDKGMATYIDNLLKSEGDDTYFVVVGFLHYLSDYSVLDILKEKGYEITQIK